MSDGPPVVVCPLRDIGIVNIGPRPIVQNRIHILLRLSNYMPQRGARGELWRHQAGPKPENIISRRPTHTNTQQKEQEDPGPQTGRQPAGPSRGAHRSDVVGEWGDYLRMLWGSGGPCADPRTTLIISRVLTSQLRLERPQVRTRWFERDHWFRAE